jgi:hypothetical protein
LVTENEDLQLLGGVAMGEQGEELDGAADRQVGELRQHPGSLQAVSGGVTLPRHDQANQQLTGHVRVSAPYAPPVRLIGTLESSASLGGRKDDSNGFKAIVAVASEIRWGVGSAGY